MQFADATHSGHGPGALMKFGYKILTSKRFFAFFPLNWITHFVVSEKRPGIFDFCLGGRILLVLYVLGVYMFILSKIKFALSLYYSREFGILQPLSLKFSQFPPVAEPFSKWFFLSLSCSLVSVSFISWHLVEYSAVWNSPCPGIEQVQLACLSLENSTTFGSEPLIN